MTQHEHEPPTPNLDVFSGGAEPRFIIAARERAKRLGSTVEAVLAADLARATRVRMPEEEEALEMEAVQMWERLQRKGQTPLYWMWKDRLSAEHWREERARRDSKGVIIFAFTVLGAVIVTLVLMHFTCC